MSQYILGKDGVYKKFQTDLFRGQIKVGFPIPFQKELDTIEVPEKADELRERIEIIFKRMPIGLFQQALAFMEFCYEEKKSEGMVCFRYRNEEWSLVIPEQWNSGTSVCYHLLPEEASFIMGDVHSHPKFATSTHSGTDNLDERKLADGIFMVVKDFDVWNCEPSILGVVDGVSFPIKPKYMFNMKQAADKPTPDVPDEWKARVHSTPCDGCKREREGKEAVQNKTEAERKAEEEKKARLVPAAIVDIYKKEVAQGKSRGEAVKEVINKWQQAMKYSGKLFLCRNFHCKKYNTSLTCPECKDSFSAYDVMESIAQAIDEVDAHDEVKGELELITALTMAKQEAPKEAPAEARIDDSDIVLVGEGPDCSDACHHKKNGTPHTHFDPAKVKSDLCKNVECARAGHVLLSCQDRIAKVQESKVPSKETAPVESPSASADVSSDEGWGG